MNEWLGCFAMGDHFFLDPMQGLGITSEERDALFSKWMDQIQHQVLFLFSFLRFYFCRSSRREVVVFEESGALLLRR